MLSLSHSSNRGRKIYRSGVSLSNIVPDLVSGVIRSRELIWRLFVREFRVRYRQTLLGFGWAVLQPLLWVAVFAVVAGGRGFSTEELGSPFLVFALSNMAIWSLIGTGLGFCVQALQSNAAIIVRINIAKDAIIFAGYGNVLVETLVRLVLAGLVMAVYGWSVPVFTVPLALLAMVPLMLTALGLGMVLAALNLVIRDVGLIVPFLSMMCMLVSPVLYLPAPDSLAETIMSWNPIYWMMENPSHLLIHGTIKDPLVLAYCFAGSVILFILCWVVFTISMRRAVERV